VEGAVSSANDIVLDVSDVVTRFHTLEGVVHAVNGASFQLQRGEAMAIVGESACGKSVTMLSIMGLIQPPGEVVAGHALLNGEDLMAKSEQELQKFRGEGIAMIFQNASAALNPAFTIGDQMTEMYTAHTDSGKQAATERSLDLLERVRVADRSGVMKEYPHEISMGTAQRVMIATALLCNPDVLVADEPTTNLDSISQIELLALIDEIREERGLSIILITHDFGVVVRLADRVGVMYAGKIVEEGDLESIVQHPLHPYTLALINSVPRRGSGKARLYQIAGQPPDATSLPSGCTFAPRCPYVMEICRAEEPPIRRFGDRRWIRCYLEEGVRGE
jgi:peptide/nickel transport system ATP-binding protein